jgi:CRISPR-associated protein Cmr4
MEGVLAMFEAKQMLFIYVETPLHAGTGHGLGAVDLPIQRERTTGYPIVQASSLKGRLRAEAYARDQRFQKRFAELKVDYEAKIPLDEKDKEKAKAEANRRARRDAAQEAGLEAIFGPETEGAAEYAGALSTGDARILLFPVRSLAGVFAWTTSVDVLARFQRQVEIMGLKLNWELQLEPNHNEKAWVNGNALVAGSSVVLEEFSFTPDTSHAAIVQTLGNWLASNALPEQGYDYWKQTLPQKLCILPEDAFRDFVLYGTEVQTHIRLDPGTKTVAGTALWTTESLPGDALLYAPLMATRSRADGVKMSGKEVLEGIVKLGLTRTQLGGDETTGQGMVALRFAGGVK